MTRDEINDLALSKIDNTKCLILELSTGTGKSRIAINCINKICDRVFKKDGSPTSVLLLVAKKVHKQNWIEEIKKWGGLNTDYLTIECYESLRKYKNQRFDAVILDECFRRDTEILTNKGYRRFDCLEGDELVAQFTKEGNIEFVKPLRYIKKKATEGLIKMHLGRNRYCYLTPNHNQVYRTKAIQEWRLKPIKDLKENYTTKIPISGKGTGNNILLTPLERLSIAIQADGTLQRHQKNGSVYSIQVKKERKKERLSWILNQIDSNLWTKIKCKESYDRYLIKMPIGNHKILSEQFNINVGYDRAKDFINEILQWDGYVNNNLKYYSSKIKENTDFVSAIAVQAGYKSLVSIEKDDRKETFKDIYRVFMYEKKDVDTQTMIKEFIPYEDNVYCVEVPSNMIVVRSDGYTFISGNCHHLSNSRREILETIHVNECIIGLSATIKQELKDYLSYKYNAEFISCGITEAIENNILPEPTIYLLPLKLDTIKYTYKAKKFKKDIIVTQQGYYNTISSMIDWYKEKYMRTRNQRLKNVWLASAGNRLKWLSEQKESIILSILDMFKNRKTLTFCSSIEQSKRLGKYNITSKNNKSEETLNKFNNNKIKHITSVNILNEGMNLTNCQIGIFANINASEIIVRQRQGRLLRHKNPIIIIPYYVNTREEELVNNMIEDYNKDIVKTINNIKEITL